MAPTPDGEGIQLRWHQHRPTPVPIPALQLLAVTGHANAASLPPAEESEFGDGDSEMSDAASHRGHNEEDEADEDDSRTERGNDDRRSQTPVQAGGPPRYATEPVEGHYDPSPLRRGRSIDPDAINAAHAARTYPQLVANGDAVRQEWGQAERMGVFSGVRVPAPMDMPTGNIGAGPSAAQQGAQNMQNYGYNAPAGQPQPQQAHQAQPQQAQQPPQRFPPLLGGSVIRRNTTASLNGQNQRARTSSFVIDCVLQSEFPLAVSRKGKERDMGGPSGSWWIQPRQDEAQ